MVGKIIVAKILNPLTQLNYELVVHTNIELPHIIYVIAIDKLERLMLWKVNEKNCNLTIERKEHQRTIN